MPRIVGSQTSPPDKIFMNENIGSTYTANAQPIRVPKNVPRIPVIAPHRKKIFKVIPFKRQSSSFGYSQAIKGTWEQYKKETGNKLATRARFKDSVDFIGWYTNKTETILKISKKDAFKQYLAYHEGWGNFKHYKKNKKVIGLAKKVEKQAGLYRRQLSECSKSLNKNKYIIF